MADPRMLRRLKTVVFWQEIQFISIISIQKPMQRDQFPTKNEGYGGRAINYFYPKIMDLSRRHSDPELGSLQFRWMTLRVSVVRAIRTDVGVRQWLGRQDHNL